MRTPKKKKWYRFNVPTHIVQRGVMENWKNMRMTCLCTCKSRSFHTVTYLPSKYIFEFLLCVYHGAFVAKTGTSLMKISLLVLLLFKKTKRHIQILMLLSPWAQNITHLYVNKI